MTSTARLRRSQPMALVVAAVLASCGSAPDPRASRAEPAPGPGGSAAATPGIREERPARLVSDYVPPRPVQQQPPVAPSVEACIEKQIHTPDYDAMGPRDARRKLRRLQLKADCEERLASR